VPSVEKTLYYTLTLK